MESFLEKEITDNLKKGIRMEKFGIVTYQDDCDVHFKKIMELKLQHRLAMSDVEGAVKSYLIQMNCNEAARKDVWLSILGVA